MDDTPFTPFQPTPAAAEAPPIESKKKRGPRRTAKPKRDKQEPAPAPKPAVAPKPPRKAAKPKKVKAQKRAFKTDLATAAIVFSGLREGELDFLSETAAALQAFGKNSRLRIVAALGKLFK